MSNETKPDVRVATKEDELREEAELQVYLNQYRQALYQLGQFIQQNTLGTLMLSEAVGLDKDAPYGGLDLYLIPRNPSLAWSTSSGQQTCSTSGSARSMHKTNRYLASTGPSWSILASDLSSFISIVIGRIQQMSKVVYFTAIMHHVLADKINVWLLAHPGYRIAAMPVVRNPGEDCDAWVAFESV